MRSVFLFLAFTFIYKDVPKLKWLSPALYDFGTVSQNKEVTHTFNFLNDSDAALKIDNVRTDCSCTSPDWEKIPTQPHQTGKIMIAYDAVKIGYFKKKIAVWIHGQRKPEFVVIEGVVQ